MALQASLVVPEAQISDAELVARAASGDRHAIALIWARYRRMVRSMLLSTLGQDQEIDDLVQEVFLGLFRVVQQVRDGHALPAILARMAVRRAGMMLRKRRVRAILTVLPWTELPEVPVRAVDLDDRRAVKVLYRLLDQLPTRSRVAFILHDVEGMATVDIAGALGVSLATAKRAVADGRQRIDALARQEPALQAFVADKRGSAK